MKLIDEARESLIMQTLIFKEDESGMATAEALVRAAKRGVDVRVVIDALGNLETLDHLIDGRPLYQYLRENGVKLELYNHPSAQGLGSLVNALDRIDALSAVKSPDDLKDPTLLFSLLRDAAQVAFGPETMNSDAKADLIAWFDAHSTLPGETDDDVLLELPNGAVIAAAEAVTMGKMLVELNHRWHEKYLVADGNKAIVGGLNIADEYMFGGTDRKIMSPALNAPLGATPTSSSKAQPRMMSTTHSRETGNTLLATRLMTCPAPMDSTTARIFSWFNTVLVSMVTITLQTLWSKQLKPFDQVKSADFERIFHSDRCT